MPPTRLLGAELPVTEALAMEALVTEPQGPLRARAGRAARTARMEQARGSPVRNRRMS
ncbi:hypothetical protein MN0502_17850 [Arthrobacter sp. MN05-02]|nr:hypothetical protein MN0502_17850 [Arthrobacter sp. MN05-02]